LLEDAQNMAAAVTAELGGHGIWGVEFFIQNATEDAPGSVYFSELSPRPHDTGMVTLAGTQNFSEFELHARAVLGLPVAEIEALRNGASAVVLAPQSIGSGVPVFDGVLQAAAVPQTDIRLFGKPSVRPYRRMGVAVAYGDRSASVATLTEKAKQTAALIQVRVQD
jgi:phosphoribosylglycinamide formyltransferase 2